LRNVTTGQVVTSPTPIAYSGADDSAEWIEENPGSGLSYPAVGTITFTSVGLNGSPPNLDRIDNGLDMVQNGRILAATSEFRNDSFTVTSQ
jgi:hypothetical protein